MNFTEFPQEDVTKAIIELVEQNKFGPAYPSVTYDHDKTEEWIALLSQIKMDLKLDSEHEEDEMCNAYRIERKLEWEMKIGTYGSSTMVVIAFCSRYFPYPPKECFNTIHIEITVSYGNGKRGRVQVGSTNLESFTELLHKKIVPEFYGSMYGI